MRWRYLDTGYNTGDYNMALDAAIVRGGFCDMPTLRIFRWKPSCISLGFHQNHEEIDLAKCQGAGIDVARRPTAGRAILHAEEVTYGVMIPASQSWYRMLPLDFYRRISEALAYGLQSIGAKVKFAPGEKLAQNGRPLRMSCFASAARNEIVADGKKVVGSAQRRFRKGTLQHGSIILSDEHLDLVEFLAGSESEIFAERQRLMEHTISLERICQRKVHVEEIVRAIRHGFCEVLGIKFEEQEVLKEEQTLAQTWRLRYQILNNQQLEEKLCKS